VIAIVEVAAEREGAAEAWLPQAVAARAGDLLLGPPLALVDG